MRIIALTAALAAMTVAGLTAAPAAALNYDCTKAGNATKAACKGKVPAKAAAPAKLAPKAVAVSKAAPKAAPARMAPVKAATGTAWTTKTGKTVHYDCAKAGNKTKQACKR